MIKDFVYSKAKELLDFQVKKSKEFRPLQLQWWNQLILNFSAKNPSLQRQLFKYVDLYPTLKNDPAKRKFLAEYLQEKKICASSSLDLINKLPIMNDSLSIFTKLGIQAMSQNFIVSKEPEILQAKIDELKSKGLSYTLDILGELVVSDEEADHYYNSYLKIIKDNPGTSISIKLSSLYAHLKAKSYNLNKKTLFPRLKEIFLTAKENNAHVTVDSEHYEYKDLFFDLVKEVLSLPELQDWDGAGIVIQAYLKESKNDLLGFIDYAKKRKSPFKIRLVKGAYWDYERAIALQNNWEIPVYENKAETDSNYEELIELLMKEHRFVKPAIASHNMRSAARTLELAEQNSIDKKSFEFQFLYGMLDPIKEKLSNDGYQVNVYIPFGELIEGMAYLVRRLLENTANNSFVYQSLNSSENVEKLLEDPKVTLQEDSNALDQGKQINNPINNFSNAANQDFSKSESRREIETAIHKLENKINSNRLEAYSIINSKNIRTNKIVDSVNPANKDQSIAKINFASEELVDTAMDHAKASYKFWKKTSPETRISILRSFAKKLESERNYYNSLLILEAAKPWEEADAELSEAVDFLNYYASLAEELYTGNRLRSFPGEDNQNIYQALGVAVVISPWNFPLAIMLGMAAAALVTGNTVIVKPSENTSYIAYEIINEFNKFIQSHLGNKSESKAILQLLLGEGSTVGNALVKHEKTSLVSFTGSKYVGMNINKIAHEDINLKKRVITEMGGKNAIIVDETADLDEVVPAVIKSAFYFGGQKCSACSRLIVVEELYEDLKERLVKAAESLIIDEAKKAETDLSALIDKKALEKVKRYINKAKLEGKVLLSELKTPNNGFYISPHIIADLPASSLLIKEEIFGPVLALIKVKNLDEAINTANDTNFGLTGAIFSRSPKNIETVKNDLEVGNLYVTQSCTGAIVSRQAFGGTKLSSIGYKAGGPNYLLQFLEEKTITENTMRHGMIV